jgi:hypothetical protein
MSATLASPTPAPSPPAPRRPGGGRRIAGVLLGSVSALAMLGGGTLLVLDHTERDADGYFTSKTAHVGASGYAVSSQRLDLSGTGDVLSELASDVRVTAHSTDGRAVFVGVGRDADVDRYLAGVARSEVTDVDSDAHVSYEQHAGAAPSGAPAMQRFWTATATGTGTQRLHWKPSEGKWAVVVMHADGSRGVHANVRVAAKSSLLRWAGWSLAGGGLLLALGAGGLLVSARRSAARAV